MEVTKDDMDIVSALRATLADKVGKERFELVVRDRHVVPPGRRRLDHRRAEPLLPRLDPLEFPPADRKRLLGDARQLPRLEVQRGRRRGRSGLAAVRGGQGRSARCRAAADEAGPPRPAPQRA